MFVCFVVIIRCKVDATHPLTYIQIYTLAWQLLIRIAKHLMGAQQRVLMLQVHFKSR